MSTLSVVPLTYDVDYIIGEIVRAGVVNHYGYSVEEDGIHIRYRAPDFDAVQAVLDAYQTQYADEVLRERLMGEATALRRVKQALPTAFMGMEVPTDDVTVGRITAAAYLMSANPQSPQTRRWKIANGVWVDLDKTALVGMGTAIALHIQQCFEHEEALHSQLLSAETVDDLLEVDLEEGWPV
jgi:hypothetical protein